MQRVVDGRRYDTDKATLVASDRYWDGSNFERHGRNTYLYRTPRGAFFVVNTTLWQGEQDHLAPVSLEQARELYEGPLTEHALEHESAFPGVAVEDA